MMDFETFESVFQTRFVVSKVNDSFERENYNIIYSDITLTELTSHQSPCQPPLTPHFKDSQDVKEFVNYYSPRQVGSPHRSQISTVNQNISKPTPASTLDILQSCEIVDEIVETRAKELLNWGESNTEYNQCLMSTPSTPTKLSEEYWSCMSQSSLSPSSLNVDSSSSESGSKMQKRKIFDKKCNHPYDLDFDPKKEQNKNAATRYRQKKKQEMKNILSEEQELTNWNIALQSMLADRKREVKYLKNLIRESYQSRIYTDGFQKTDG